MLGTNGTMMKTDVYDLGDNPKARMTKDHRRTKNRQITIQKKVRL